MDHTAPTTSWPVDDQPLHDLPLDDLPLDDLRAAYGDRGLDRASDGQLVSAVVAVVAEPRQEPANSFVLHAPLELTARARLLERTPAAARHEARLRLLSIAARYQGSEPADVVTDAGPIDRTEPATVGALIDAIDRGDLVGVDLAARRLSGPDAGDPAGMLGPLAAAIADRTAAAAHGPIFLATLSEAVHLASGWLPMLRPLARELARRPEHRIGWIDRVEAGQDRPSANGEALFRVLADPPRLGIPGSSFIHPLLMQVDADGVADELLGPIAGPGVRVTSEASRAVTRVAALAMVRDDADHAPYGWTHCLTLPQAVLTLATPIEARGGHPLAIAATQVLAFRAAQGSQTLDPNDPLIRPAEPVAVAERGQALVVEAARRHDAHIAKYILASLTAAEADPDASELHLGAAEHLLAVWDDLGPDPDDLLG